MTRTPCRMIESGDVRLAVYETGDAAKPTVLLVHGYPDTHAVWDEIVPLLADRFHVVSYDVRGAGVSSTPRDRSAYELTRLSADLIAVADAVSPEAPVHVLAHDWGSIQAWEPVTEPSAQRRIASFTSISGPCLDHVGYWIRSKLSKPSPRNVAKAFRQLVHSWYILAFHLPKIAPLVWRLWLTQRWAEVLRRYEGVTPSGEHPAATLASDAVVGISLYRANMLPRLTKPRPRPTQVPVQVIQPAGDRYVRPQLTEELQRWVPKLWRRTLQARHWAPLTHPRPIARMVREFVDHIEGAPETRSLRRGRATGTARFADHLVVVTGGGSGIGQSTALALATNGADVVVCDVDLVGAQRTVDRARALGVRAAAYRVDVADESAMREFASAVAGEHGVPDIVVNNAGIGHAGSFFDTTAKDWERVLDVNLWGVIHGCRVFGELMLERAEGGHIVNVSSAAAYLPSKVMSTYGASKAAVYMLSDCLRAEVSAHGIGVSTICPGFVHTNITRTTTFAGLSAEEQAAKQERATNLYRRRNFGPDRVAKQILRAVERDVAVMPVTVEAHAARVLSRVSPGVLRAAATIDPTE